ncbi:hypothetical protein OF83DRAFT_627327 [Amylostereum chailletii]|nr:hypothetical protein OF83DRAFT_627327 [Amylostereum chailletii]
MRTEMNALLPVSLLPAEILCKIFAIAIAAAIGPTVLSTHKFHIRPSSGWITTIKLSHVCGSWRETALGCPALWADVSFDRGEHWRTVFLERSCEAAIDIRAEILDMDWRIPLAVLSEHLHRVRRLFACVVSQDTLDILSSPAPLLENLDLVNYVTGPLPPNLLSGNAPRLTTFALTDPPAFPAHPTLYANISKFSISCKGLPSLSPPFQAPSVSDFFSTLQSMSKITYLHLNGCLPAVQDPSWPEHTLHFPHLSYLDVKGPITSVSGVLHQIRLARACTLRALCDMSDDPLTDARDVTLLVRALQRTGFFGSSEQKAGDAFVVRALSVHSYVEDTLKVFAWRTPFCVDECSALVQQTDPPLLLRLQWPGTIGGQETRHSAVGVLICELLPLDALEVLHLESYWFGWPTERWRTLFGRCAKVRSVHSGHVDVSALFRALSPPSELRPPSDGRANALEVLFPSLSSLSVFNVNFSAPATEGSVETMRDWLRRLFHARRAAGHPVAKLSVGKSRTVDWAEELRDVVSVTRLQDFRGDVSLEEMQGETNLHEWDQEWDGHRD